VVPELRPYHRVWGSRNWTRAPGILDYIEQRLDRYPHKGIGEFHVHFLDDDDTPLLDAVARMALARDIPIHLHSGAKPVARFFELQPDLTIIWAHSGLGESTGTIRATLERFPNLYADTSLREWEINGGNDIEPEWKEILIRFQDRMMVGSDTWVNGQWDSYETIMADHRRYLNLLPRDVAEKIAYRNAEKLFGIKVTMDLIGKRK